MGHGLPAEIARRPVMRPDAPMMRPAMTTLEIYNTLTRRKEPFAPIAPGQVQMYCCGVTVYDYCHLGHARSYVVWDTVRRYLEWRGYQVRYVQNFTDIDDKILNRARQEGTTMEAIADRYVQTYFEDMARLNVREANAYPRATHTLNGIQRLIAELEQGGYAYASAGDVYYAVRQFPSYGKLSGRKLEDLQAGASGRVDAGPGDPRKRDPFDFALWKSAKPDEPAWASPWGPGRPGWHIECSAMVREAFGPSIDIHVGGGDLVFPHHENEIAQSEAATGHPLSRYWMHNGMVNVGGEKMSKSLGNFTTIRDLLDGDDAPEPMAVRLFVLQAHYRKPLDFTTEAIAAARNSWATLREGLAFGEQFGDRLGGDWTAAIAPDADAPALAGGDHSPTAFQTAMDDDFNTPEALAVVFELAKELRRQGNRLTHGDGIEGAVAAVATQWRSLVALAAVLGLELTEADRTALAPAAATLSEVAIAEAIAARQAARQAKNFAAADRLRDDLKAQGVILVDRPEGTTWYRT